MKVLVSVCVFTGVIPFVGDIVKEGIRATVLVPVADGLRVSTDSPSTAGVNAEVSTTVEGVFEFVGETMTTCVGLGAFMGIPVGSGSAGALTWGIGFCNCTSSVSHLESTSESLVFWSFRISHTIPISTCGNSFSPKSA